jgi:RNA polymerase sigma-70 factor (ECF subfamily)
MIPEEQIHISRLRTGNTLSFEHLYNLYGGKLYHFVMRISRGDRYLAEEISQSVFAKVWENREQLDPEKSFAAYICTIAKNQLSNLYQHRIQELLYREKMKDVFPAEDTTDRDTDFRLLEEFIDSHILQMPPARREIFILSRRRFLPNKEIARRLNISEHTVESQITKALSFLRKALNDDGG